MMQSIPYQPDQWFTSHSNDIDDICLFIEVRNANGIIGNPSLPDLIIQLWVKMLRQLEHFKTPTHESGGHHSYQIRSLINTTHGSLCLADRQTSATESCCWCWEPFIRNVKHNAVLHFLVRFWKQTRVRNRIIVQTIHWKCNPRCCSWCVSLILKIHKLALKNHIQNYSQEI